MSSTFTAYADRLNSIISTFDWSQVEELAQIIRECWADGRQLFLCGNGGSAGNAIHLANDFVYGCQENGMGRGIKVHALTANPATITCLANDEGYDTIFSLQLRTYARKGDVLLAFSGSGNSPNIVAALDVAKEMGLKTAAVLGFDGGKCLNMADLPIHFDIKDMQISEDMQIIIGHMIMQWLRANPPTQSLY